MKQMQPLSEVAYLMVQSRRVGKIPLKGYDER